MRFLCSKCRIILGGLILILTVVQQLLFSGYTMDDAFISFRYAQNIALGHGWVYNIGGGRHANCSMIEAIKMAETITNRKFNWKYSDTNRVGDHIWWISDVSRFQAHYPQWKFTHNIEQIMETVINGQAERLLL